MRALEAIRLENYLSRGMDEQPIRKDTNEQCCILHATEYIGKKWIRGGSEDAHDTNKTSQESGIVSVRCHR